MKTDFIFANNSDIDNNSVHSTKVYLDRKLVGSFQEHFEPILTGGVFVVNAHQGGGLFKNFLLKPCNQFDVNGVCMKGTTLSLIIQKMIYRVNIRRNIF